GREAAAIAAAIHLEDDRDRRIARAEEVAVQRVADAVLDSLVGRQQRLGDDLTTVDALTLVGVGRRAAEEVHLQPLEPERLDEGLGGLHRWSAMLQLRRAHG